MSADASLSTQRALQPGATIVNARGVPGALGALAMASHTGATVLVSSYHVLFGGGAHEGEAVWSLERDGSGRPRRLGICRYGRLGTVSHDGVRQFIDCAIAELDNASAKHTLSVEPLEEATTSEAKPGSIVTKTTHGTGTTRGVIVDVAHDDMAIIEGRRVAAPGQIRIRPSSGIQYFSALGDSGALVHDESGRIVGLLWGRNARGESIACRITPVLRTLGVRLARLVSRREDRAG